MVQIETLIIKSSHCLMVQGHFFCKLSTLWVPPQDSTQSLPNDKSDMFYRHKLYNILTHCLFYNYFTINFLWNSSLFHISFLPYQFFLLWTPSMYVNRKSVKFSAISNWQPQTINGSTINLIEVFFWIISDEKADKRNTWIRLSIYLKLICHSFWLVNTSMLCLLCIEKILF